MVAQDTIFPALAGDYALERLIIIAIAQKEYYRN
ncbi:MAG: hypothetical protein RIR11_3708 [Bacteroidota bacterium]